MRPKLVGMAIGVLALQACAAASSSDVVDGCGHDLSNLHSTVVALEPETGATVWTTQIPLAETWMATEVDGEVRVRLAGKGRDKDARLSPATGQMLGFIAAHHELGTESVPEDLPQAAPPARKGDMRAYMDGLLIPWNIDIDGVQVSRALTDPVTVTGSDPSTGEVTWTYRPTGNGVSFPAAFDGWVVVVTNDDRPTCV